ncbi:hypothetical protein [Cyclobacterium plantarum]|uniref:Uncharacterized protein n=1 Tax=Cyclobacterium plantarum TaxID=2716263 RepID=A0ABX0H4W9_9BACT|nr:hypothetical protein [Cyclobacterium plantarum]NHE56470.1 hypothetical protein [Cyclobacterium plantarum]
MKLFTQIKAYLVIVIMLFGMMHNAFPHVHHEHDLDEHTVLVGESHHHHHSDHHPHSDEEENDDEEKAFFDFLFKNHSHTKHTHQHTPSPVEHVKTVKQVLAKFFGANDSWEFSAIETDIGLHSYVLFNDIGLEAPNLNSNSLRGPPSLG